MLELYEGLQQLSLNDFDVLLTGYMPSALTVQAVGKIGRDVKFNAGTKPGSFFWGKRIDVEEQYCARVIRQGALLTTTSSRPSHG